VRRDGCKYKRKKKNEWTIAFAFCLAISRQKWVKMDSKGGVSSVDGGGVFGSAVGGGDVLTSKDYYFDSYAVSCWCVEGVPKLVLWWLIGVLLDSIMGFMKRC